ncbi:MAG: hypothetical protein IJ641_02285 [Lachnospiraceae bacterium]|nr:hypothetical protein [Lachnospiraceae bacterium]
MRLIPLTEIYDLTMPGYSISTAFMLIAIFRYRLLDTETLAREYVIDELSEDMRKDAFQAIIEIAHNMDFGMMEYLLQDLKSYELSPEDTDIVKQIEGMLVELDWDGIEKAAKAGMGLK